MKSTTYTVSAYSVDRKTDELLRAMAKHYKISMSAIIRMAITEKAEKNPAFASMLMSEIKPLQEVAKQ